MLLAGLAGVAILLGPLALLAAGVIGAATMVLIQALILGGLYLAAPAIKARRGDRDG